MVGVGLALCLWPSVLASYLGDPSKYRPTIHYSPPSGFMNDPNGLVIKDHEFHLFYQYDPYAPIIGNVHWGHAVSGDLVRWVTLPVAINETAAGQAFSGSAVIFNNSLIAAIYTRASETKQAQELAFSSDNGRTFQEYKGNPVLDRNSDSFRDPQVFWDERTHEYKMTVVKARKHQVLIYGSRDLVNWRELSSFGPAGILGIDYECPNLMRVPTEDGHYKWVLAISINPGSPLGGSGTQYFVGDFDGTTFTPDYYETKFVDFGKDFYALQTYSNARAPLGIAWLSNWQYANFTPTGDWRGVMTLARGFGLRYTEDFKYFLTQKPVGLENLYRREVPVGAESCSVPGDKALEIHAIVELGPRSRISFSLLSENHEQLVWGYDANAGQAWIDRGRTFGFSQRFFTDKMSVAVIPGTTNIDLHAIFDKSTFELFLDDGTFVGTCLVFFEKLPNCLRYSLVGDGRVTNLTVNVLTP